MCFSLVPPLDQNPDRKYEPFFHLKKHYDLMFVIDLEAAQKSLDLHQTANGGVLRYDTVWAEFFTKIISIQDGAERFVKAPSKEKRSITNEAKQTRSSHADGNFRAQVTAPRTIANETAWRNLEHS